MPKEIPTFQPQGFSQPNLTAFSPVNVRDTSAFSQIFQVAGNISNKMFDQAFNIAKQKTAAKASRQGIQDVLDGNITAADLDPTDVSIANQAYVKSAGSLLVNNLIQSATAESNRLFFENFQDGNVEGYTQGMATYSDEHLKDLPPEVAAVYATRVNEMTIQQSKYLNFSRIQKQAKAQAAEFKAGVTSITASIPSAIKTGTVDSLRIQMQSLYENNDRLTPTEQKLALLSFDKNVQTETVRHTLMSVAPARVDEVAAHIRDDYAKGKNYSSLDEGELEEAIVQGVAVGQRRDSINNWKTLQERQEREQQAFIIGKNAQTEGTIDPFLTPEELTAKAQSLYPDDIEAQNVYTQNHWRGQEAKQAALAKASEPIDLTTSKGQKKISNEILSHGDIASAYNVALDQKTGGLHVPQVITDIRKGLELISDPASEEGVNGVQAIGEIIEQHPSLMNSLTGADKAYATIIASRLESGQSPAQILKAIKAAPALGDGELANAWSNRDVKDTYTSLQAKDPYVAREFESTFKAVYTLTGDISESLEQASLATENLSTEFKATWNGKKQNFKATGLPPNFKALEKHESFDEIFASTLNNVIQSDPLLRMELRGKPVQEAVQVMSISPSAGQTPSAIASGKARYDFTVKINGAVARIPQVAVPDLFDPEVYKERAIHNTTKTLQEKHKITGKKGKATTTSFYPNDPLGVVGRAKAAAKKSGASVDDMYNAMRDQLVPVNTALFHYTGRGTKASQLIHRSVKPNFERMAATFSQKFGFPISFASVHRTPKDQREINPSAPWSAHQFGIAFDVNMDGSKQGNTAGGGRITKTQLRAHLAKYGFHVPPDLDKPGTKAYDPNHFVYTGR